MGLWKNFLGFFKKKNFVCKECNKKFDTELDFLNHVHIPQSKPLKKVILDDINKKSGEEEIIKSDVFICRTCGRKFDTEQELLHHKSNVDVEIQPLQIEKKIEKQQEEKERDRQEERDAEKRKKLEEDRAEEERKRAEDELRILEERRIREEEERRRAELKREIDKINAIKRKDQEIERLKQIHALNQNDTEFLIEAQKFRKEFGKNIWCDICYRCKEVNYELFAIGGQTYCMEHKPPDLTREIPRKVKAGRHGASIDFIDK